MFNQYGFVFGCDPEVFITDQDGVVVPAVGLIPGTKHAPHKVDKGAIQVDGLAAEINIDPTGDFDEFRENIRVVFAQLKDFLPKGYGWSMQPTAEFTAEQLAAVPPDSLVLGCDPDINAWTGEINKPPERDKARPGFCTAAGHIHFGWREGADTNDEDHRRDCFDLVKQLDWTFGAWLSRKEGEAGAARRALYGRAGACRIKSYGVEYRVPSNLWLSYDKRVMTALWLRLQDAIETMQKSFYPDTAAKWNDELIAFVNDPIPRPEFAKTFYIPVMERLR